MHGARDESVISSFDQFWSSLLLMSIHEKTHERTRLTFQAFQLGTKINKIKATHLNYSFKNITVSLLRKINGKFHPSYSEYLIVAIINCSNQPQ